MSQSSPAKDKDKAKPKKKRRIGFLGMISLACLTVLVTGILGILCIDLLDQGDKVRAGLRSLLGKPNVKIVEVEKIIEKKPPLPSGYVEWKKIDTAKMWNGIQVTNTVDAPQGDLATVEREKEGAFQIEMKLSFKVPRASQTMQELEQVNANLAKMLPGLPAMVKNSSVSPYYHKLYENKVNRIQQKATRLSEVLSVHNLYDTETMLELKHAESGQKVFLVQADMDVVSDGSDGDRWPFLDNYISMSPYYQPFTSYGWKKQTDQSNPLLGRWQAELKKHQDRFGVSGLSVKENRYLRDRISTLEGEIDEMGAKSHLIAEADPFIVISLVSFGRFEENEYTPLIGDYAVVIHENKLYPAIVGDYGPSFKYGEASLRIAKQINSKASPYNRAESDLEATYLIFPFSKEAERTPPDLTVWHQKCQEYIDKIGGLGEGYQLHQWEDLIEPKVVEWEAAKAAEAAKAKQEAEAREAAKEQAAVTKDKESQSSSSADETTGSDKPQANVEPKAEPETPSTAEPEPEPEASGESQVAE